MPIAAIKPPPGHEAAKAEKTKAKGDEGEGEGGEEEPRETDPCIEIEGKGAKGEEDEGEGKGTKGDEDEGEGKGTKSEEDEGEGDEGEDRKGGDQDEEDRKSEGTTDLGLDQWADDDEKKSNHDGDDKILEVKTDGIDKEGGEECGMGRTRRSPSTTPISTRSHGGVLISSTLLRTCSPRTRTRTSM